MSSARSGAGRQWAALTDTTLALDVEGALRAGEDDDRALEGDLTRSSRTPACTRCSRAGPRTRCRRSSSRSGAGILEKAGLRVRWNALEHYDEFPNGARAYVRGLKAQDQQTRYAKFRGLTLVARLHRPGRGDAARCLPRAQGAALAEGLSASDRHHAAGRRGDATGSRRSSRRTTRVPNRRYIPLSVYDNAHNLDADTIRNLEETYPLGHPKRQTLLDGLRGMNVIGDPVYGGRVQPPAARPAARVQSRRSRSRRRSTSASITRAGSARQVDPFGAVLFLGGIQGEDLFLDDFMRVVTRYRDEWFPGVKDLKTCCDPAGSHQSSQGLRQNGVEILRAHYPPRHRIALPGQQQRARRAPRDGRGAREGDAAADGDRRGVRRRRHALAARRRAGAACSRGRSSRTRSRPATSGPSI